MHTGRYVVMGVAGAGKSRVGAALAEALGVDFVEGDRFHPPQNVARMTAGIPLTDADRAGWLATLADQLRDARERGAGLVLACSALKRSYRDRLRTGDPGVRFVWLDGPRALLAERLAGREDHFMPAALLESQLATLEPPQPDEGAWRCDIAQTPAVLVAQLAARARAGNDPGIDPGDDPGDRT